MIILSLCQSCLQSYEILIETSDLPLLKDISDEHGYTCPCPRLCGGSINLVGNALSDIIRKKNIKDPFHLTGKDLYKAVKGLGLPDEVQIDKAILENMVQSIDSAKLEEYNGKVYLHELKLKNGMIIHLTAGLKGAQVLKITKENSNGV